MSDLAQLRLHGHILEKELEAGVDNKGRSETVKRLLDEHRGELSHNEEKWINELLSGAERTLTADRNSTFVSVIRNRRSIRKYNGGLSDKELYIMLDGSRFAPSSCNRQPVEFVVTRKPEKIKAISKIKKQPFIAEAPCCVIVLVDETAYVANKNTHLKTYFKYMDSGAAIQNVLLVAEYLNIGACWVNIKPTDVKKIKELFKIPNTLDVVALIPCGQKAYDVKMPGRKKTVIHNEFWHINAPSHS